MKGNTACEQVNWFGVSCFMHETLNQKVCLLGNIYMALRRIIQPKDMCRVANLQQIVAKSCSKASSRIDGKYQEGLLL